MTQHFDRFWNHILTYFDMTLWQMLTSVAYLLIYPWHWFWWLLVLDYFTWTEKVYSNISLPTVHANFFSRFEMERNGNCVSSSFLESLTKEPKHGTLAANIMKKWKREVCCGPFSLLTVKPKELLLSYFLSSISTTLWHGACVLFRHNSM